MIYLLLSILCSLTIAIILKKASGSIKNTVAMFMVNYIVCVICGLYFNGIPIINKESSFSLYLGIFSGFMYLASFLVSAHDISKNGVVMQTVFAKLGVIVALLISFFIFNEVFNLKQGTGIIIALLGIILIYFEKGSGSLVTSRKWLIINLLASGMTESMVSLYNYFGNPLYKDQFLLLNFCFALLFSFIIVIIQKKSISKYEILYGLGIGVPNYFSARMMMLALNTVPSIIAHPIVSVGSIASITLVGHFIFKEELSIRKWIALGMIILAIIFLS
ncbi:MAG: EamA family transporter [Erysipelotrichaceae bacterium]|nr:EamA family transporter [Erysipelotrichaceae bacterium]